MLRHQFKMPGQEPAAGRSHLLLAWRLVVVVLLAVIAWGVGGS